jgi:hypothetical protein
MASGERQAFGARTLNEVLPTGHFFAQDRWRFRPNLTLNCGLRWDIVGDDYDVNGGYSSPASIAKGKTGRRRSCGWPTKRPTCCRRARKSGLLISSLAPGSE